MPSAIFFVTGTDTGVGKTVVATLLTRHWQAQGRRVAALKPVSSGSRCDARLLRAAAGNRLPLDEVNPWHFRAPVAPVLAAQWEGHSVRLAAVVAHIHRVATRFDLLVVEGAGGLLSPMGADFDARDLLRALRAVPVVVGPNRLGIVNQIRLVLEALPPSAARKARVVLVSPVRPDAATPDNARLLRAWAPVLRLFICPRLRPEWNLGSPAPLPAAATAWLAGFDVGAGRTG